MCVFLLPTRCVISLTGLTLSLNHPTAIALNQNFTRGATSLWENKTKSNKYESAYDHFGSRPRATIYVWGHSNTTAVGAPVSDDHIIFTCIRVDKALGDSRLPSAGVRLGGVRSGWWAVVVSVAVVVIVG